jgi:murein L,D-transpeptidase YcbB/YkuD
MIRDGFNPRAWVVALGSNDFYFFKRKMLSPRTEIEAFLDLVGPSRHVVWFTIWTKRASAYYAQFNSALRDTASRHSNLHVYDWATTAKKHPEWLKEDGAHLKMPGAKARNDALAKAAVSAAKKAGALAGASSGSVGGTSRPTLQRGSQGSAVRELQRMLRAKGVNVRVDGDFGAATERGVKQFQRAHNLLADGVVGPVTWRKLDA